MASKSVKALNVFKKPSILDKGLGALLPEAYKKFYREWKETTPAAVHYIPEEGKWKRDEVTGEVTRIQNTPLPMLFTKEQNDQIWGGESVVQGFQKRHKIYKRRVPHFWFPILKRSVVYSEVLNKHMSVVLTDRAINLINENYGFDHYLLKSAACDLQSLLPLGLKRKILEELQAGCPTYSDQPEKQKEVLKTYEKYLSAYTPEEIKWYGYSFTEAINLLEKTMEEERQKQIVPLKHVFRAQLIEQLKTTSAESPAEVQESGTTAWLKKINPFGQKKSEM